MKLERLADEGKVKARDARIAISRAAPAVAAKSVGGRATSLLRLQRLVGNRAMVGMLVQRQETSFPEDAEAQLKAMMESSSPKEASAEEEEDRTLVQRSALLRTPRWQRRETAPFIQANEMVQRSGGKKVGTLRISADKTVGRSSGSSGYAFGHAWLSFTHGLDETTWGTWGKKPTGLNVDREKKDNMIASSSRSTDVDKEDKSTLDDFVSLDPGWTLINNCAAFAARGWREVTGESLNYKTSGIPNPRALDSEINNKGPRLVMQESAESDTADSSGDERAYG